MRREQRGMTLVEYAAIVAIVAAIVVALTVVRPQRVGRVPFDPVKAMRVHVRTQPPPRPRPPRVNRPTPRKRSTPSKPRSSSRPVVMSPQWFGNW